MTNIKSFKKGDWISFSFIKEVGHNDFILEENLKDACLLFKTNTRCVFGFTKAAKDNEYKYWFDLDENELSDVKFITRDDLLKLYNDYDIEIHKYKQKEDKSWHDYNRSKRDYNWKYDIAVGINSNWALCKKELLDAYLLNLQDTKRSKDKSLIRFAEEAVDNLLEGLRKEIKSKPTFMVGSNLFSGIIIKKTENYFDTMLKHYYDLNLKYSKRVNSDIYSMLFDFERTILHAKMYLLSQSDIEIVTMMMNGQRSIDDITTHMCLNFKFKKVLTANDIRFRIDEVIPKILLKAEQEVDGDKHGKK